MNSISSIRSCRVRSRNARICNKILTEKRETVRQVAEVRMRARMRTNARAVTVNEKAARPSDVNNKRGPGIGAKNPFKLNGGPYLQGPFIKNIPFNTSETLRNYVTLRSSDPDLKANKVDRLLRCHSSKRLKGYYSENNTTLDFRHIKYISLGKSKLEYQKTSESNNGKRNKLLGEFYSKNCFNFNLTWLIRLK